MTENEAYDLISDGHRMISVATAHACCTFFNVPFTENIIDRWSGQREANPDNNPKGLWLYKDEPGEGVATLRLSDHIARILTGDTSNKFVRGCRAQENAANVRRAHAKQNSPF